MSEIKIQNFLSLIHQKIDIGEIEKLEIYKKINKNIILFLYTILIILIIGLMPKINATTIKIGNYCCISDNFQGQSNCIINNDTLISGYLDPRTNYFAIFTVEKLDASDSYYVISCVYANGSNCRHICDANQSVCIGNQDFCNVYECVEESYCYCNFYLRTYQSMVINSISRTPMSPIKMSCSLMYDNTINLKRSLKMLFNSNLHPAANIIFVSQNQRIITTNCKIYKQSLLARI